jgi:hypothetical protein
VYGARSRPHDVRRPPDADYDDPRATCSGLRGSVFSPGSTFPFSAAVFPRAYCTFPCAYGTFPCAYGSVPWVYGTIPCAYCAIPRVYGTIPWAYGGIPLDDGTFPRVYGTFPRVYGTFLRVYGTFPFDDGTISLDDASIPLASPEMSINPGSLVRGVAHARLRRRLASKVTASAPTAAVSHVLEVLPEPSVQPPESGGETW